MQICDCRIFAYFSKVCMSHIFPHKLAFSMAILILLEFLLPISIRFFYLDHLVAMCPSIHVSGPQWNEMTQLVSSNSVPYFRCILGVYAVRIETDMNNMPITSLHWSFITFSQCSSKIRQQTRKRLDSDAAGMFS